MSVLNRLANSRVKNNTRRHKELEEKEIAEAKERLEYPKWFCKMCGSRLKFKQSSHQCLLPLNGYLECVNKDCFKIYFDKHPKELEQIKQSIRDPNEKDQT